MKRTLSLVLVLVMAIGLLAGCNQENPAPDPVPQPETPVISKIGLGHSLSLDRSTDATETRAASTEAYVIFGAAGFDNDGTILSASIDIVQSEIKFDQDLQLTTELSQEVPSKKDLGFDYGMKVASSIDKEWFEQIAAFEDWLLGQKVNEIGDLPRDDEGYPSEEADIVASVTMSVDDYIKVIEQAWENAVEVEAAAKVGLGIKGDSTSSRAYSNEGRELLPIAQTDVTAVAVAFNSEGKIAGAFLDVSQVVIELDAQGAITNRDEVLKTKQELKEDYGMKKASSIDKEWYEQANALTAYAVGKTVEELNSLEVDGDGYPTDSDIVASVTMGIKTYLDVFNEAYQLAK